MILGLGNPGEQYQGTRHNLGARVVQELARRHGLELRRGGLRTRKLNSLWAKGIVAGRGVIAALPLTYMNRSGLAAAAILSYFDLEPTHLVVAHDDLDLELGRIKVARKGGAAGHRGVLSIQQALGTERFIRLKLGIGRPRHQEAIEEYVLQGFYADQRSLLEQTVELAADCLEVIVGQGPQEAMQRFHRDQQREVKG